MPACLSQDLETETTAPLGCGSSPGSCRSPTVEIQEMPLQAAYEDYPRQAYFGKLLQTFKGSTQGVKCVCINIYIYIYGYLSIYVWSWVHVFKTNRLCKASGVHLPDSPLVAFFACSVLDKSVKKHTHMMLSALANPMHASTICIHRPHWGPCHGMC